jgi:hypothetical protein
MGAGFIIESNKYMMNFTKILNIKNKTSKKTLGFYRNNTF